MRDRGEDRTIHSSHVIGSTKRTNPGSSTYRRRGPFVITTIYLIFGIAWILVSDRVASVMAPTPEVFQQLQTYKGTIYVVITTVLIFFLLTTYARHINSILRQLEDHRSQLSQMVDERDRLIRELNHRVRNNFQTVIAITSLSGDDSDSIGITRRVETLSRIQDYLYDVGASGVDGATIIDEVLREYSVEAMRRGVAIESDISSFMLAVDSAAPLAVALGELVRYAIGGTPFGDEGVSAIVPTVRVALRFSSEHTTVTLTRAAIAGEERPSFPLARALMEQINGSIELRESDGEVSADIIVPRGVS